MGDYREEQRSSSLIIYLAKTKNLPQGERGKVFKYGGKNICSN